MEDEREQDTSWINDYGHWEGRKFVIDAHSLQRIASEDGVEEIDVQGFTIDCSKAVGPGGQEPDQQMLDWAVAAFLDETLPSFKVSGDGSKGLYAK